MAADWLPVAGLGVQVLGLAILFFGLLGSKSGDFASLRGTATLAVFLVLLGVGAQFADLFIVPAGGEEYLYVVYRHFP